MFKIAVSSAPRVARGCRSHHGLTCQSLATTTSTISDPLRCSLTHSDSVHVTQYLQSRFISEGPRDVGYEPLCWNCGKSGHLSSNCPLGIICIRCGEKGHMAKECTNSDRSKVRCRRCGGTGHIASECTQQKKCFICGSTDHMAKNCSTKRGEVKKCFICGSTDHMAKNCSTKRGEVKKCFICGSTDHMAKNCSTKRGEVR